MEEILCGTEASSPASAVWPCREVDGLWKMYSGDSVLTDVIKEKVISNMNENERILNVNIPEKVLKNAGLSKNQYMHPNDEMHKTKMQKLTHKKGKTL